MLQIDVQPFASDALEDAMRLAQTKSLNSYTFSDCINYLNYAWSDIYNRVIMIDAGYYSKTVRLTEVLTKLPPFVKSSVSVYTAQQQIGYDRMVYRKSGAADLMSPMTYNISGTDLYCPDAIKKRVWLNYVPSCPQLFFTHHNRDPKIIEVEEGTEYAAVHNNLYGMYMLVGKDATGIAITLSNATTAEIAACTIWQLVNRSTNAITDITDAIINNKYAASDNWQLTYISCDFPYIFVTYTNSVTSEHVSGIIDKQLVFNEYNPFAFTGRNSDVEYLKCSWNDKTGMGVVIRDYNDNNLIKEIGWTPDTKLIYPAPEMYRYLVARLADKFSALNESNVMGVQKELAEAKYAFEAFINKDKSAWSRITNVNIATLGDYL